MKFDTKAVSKTDEKQKSRLLKFRYLYLPQFFSQEIKRKNKCKQNEFYETFLIDIFPKLSTNFQKTENN